MEKKTFRLPGEDVIYILECQVDAPTYIERRILDNNEIKLMEIHCLIKMYDSWKEYRCIKISDLINANEYFRYLEEINPVHLSIDMSHGFRNVPEFEKIELHDNFNNTLKEFSKSRKEALLNLMKILKLESSPCLSKTDHNKQTY